MRISKADGLYERVYVVEGESVEQSENLRELQIQVNGFLDRVPEEHRLTAQYDWYIVQSCCVCIDVYYDVLVEAGGSV